MELTVTLLGIEYIFLSSLAEAIIEILRNEASIVNIFDLTARLEMSIKVLTGGLG